MTEHGRKIINTVVDYTDKEVEDMGRNMAELEGRRNELMANHKDVCAEFRADKKELTAEIDVLTSKINGEYEESILCDLRLNKEEGFREWVSVAGGEVVLAEPLQPGDLDPLFDGQSEDD